MNDNQLSPDDPRLTAYALGELGGGELAAVEAALRDDPVARAAVAEIRATAAQLTAALASEAMPPLRAEPSTGVAPSLASAAIIPGHDPSKLDGGDWQPRKMVQFPRSYLALGGLAAAACLALVITLRQSPPPDVKPVAGEVAAMPAMKKSLIVVAPAPVAAPAPAQAPAADQAAGTVSVVVAPVAGNAPANEHGFASAPAPVLLEKAKDAGARDKQVDAVAFSSPAPALAAPPTATGGIAAAAPPPVAEVDLRKAGTLTFRADEKSVAATQSTMLTAAAKAAPMPPPAAARRAESVATSRTVASTSRDLDRIPVGETRGLPPFLPTFDLSKVSPRFAPGPGAKADDGARDHRSDFISVGEQPVSSFAIDTDTAGYADVRSFLQKRQRPPREVVHIEEMLNFFPFRYTPPKGDVPFAASMEVADAPWFPEHRLVRIGLKAREVTATPRPPVMIMFVIDVADVERLSSRLPLIKGAILSLLGTLQPRDRVGIVTCLNQASVLLEPTPAAKSREIADALDRLTPGGATSRMKGIQLAYGAVEAHAAAGDNSRVILCTDGNAELTITAEGPFARFLDGKKKSGVAFTAFGFGMGIYHDSLIDFVADYGSGNWAYIDTRRDAEKLLAEDVNGPPVTIAKDVTVEVAFNPAKVARYRLIGYDNHVLKKDDFKGDLFDTDEIGAGHAVTALFEIEPAPARDGAARVAAVTAPDPNELLTMKVRYKKPGGALKRKLDFPLFDSRTRFVDASADFKFAAAVAGLGMILSDSPHKGATTLTQVIEWAEASASSGDDPGGYRSEFVELAREAEKIER